MPILNIFSTKETERKVKKLEKKLQPIAEPYTLNIWDERPHYFDEDDLTEEYVQECFDGDWDKALGPHIYGTVAMSIQIGRETYGNLVYVSMGGIYKEEIVRGAIEALKENFKKNLPKH